MQAHTGDGRRRLLLVDDRPEICDVIRAYLEAEGYEVTSVNSGEAALAKLSTDRFDILLVDAVMPGVDGLCIAEIAARNGAAVLLMTGSPEALENLSAASYAFIAKPFHLRDLLMRLSDIEVAGGDVGAADANAEHGAPDAPGPTSTPEP